VIFTETKLQGAYLIEMERLPDERGFFARSWCRQEFTAQGLNAQLVQCSVSFNAKQGTLRGMHYQIKPYEEAKLVRCTQGAIYDVIVDLRQASATFGEQVGYTLTQDNHKMLYVPEGFAHGFLTLSDNTEVFYQMSEFYAPGAARGFRWDDPSVGIHWPEDIRIISERDRELPDFSRIKGVKHGEG
jgi:dTDP-4-dehydrorhamnose 3,5-epimerase